MKRIICCRCHLFIVITLMSAAYAQAEFIDFRPGDAPGVPFAINPSAPTVADTISFSHPLDGVVYGNACGAASVFGTPYLAIDESQQTVSMLFDESAKPGLCTRELDPVTGLEGDFGPLAAGDWALVGPFGQTRSFAVVPEPSTLLLATLTLLGLFAHGRRRLVRTNRHLDLL